MLQELSVYERLDNLLQCESIIHDELLINKTSDNSDDKWCYSNIIYSLFTHHNRLMYSESFMRNSEFWDITSPIRCLYVMKSYPFDIILLISAIRRQVINAFGCRGVFTEIFLPILLKLMLFIFSYEREKVNIFIIYYLFPHLWIPSAVSHCMSLGYYVNLANTGGNIIVARLFWNRIDFKWIQIRHSHYAGLLNIANFHSQNHTHKRIFHSDI